MDKACLKRVSTVAKVIFGNVFYAFVIRLFLLPGNLMTGGTTGIGLVVKHFTGASISGFVLAFNIVMLIVGVIFLGKKFALTTILSSFTYPIALEAANHIFADLVITDNPMLNTIFAGLGIGGLLNLLASMIISVFGRDGFMSANSIIYPLANVVRTLAFILMAMLLKVSGGSFTLPYVVFIVIDIIGAGLIMLIPYKKA